MLIFLTITFIAIIFLTITILKNALKSNYSTLNNSINYQTVDITDLLEAEFPIIYYLILDE